MDRRVAAFRHEPHEPLGYIEIVLKEKNIPIQYIDLYDTNEVPRNLDATHLIFMGGPMSVNDETELPWLVQEKERIRQSGKAGQKVLGICLGAQLIASAFGRPVFRYVNETGWHLLQKQHGVPGIFAGFPEQFPVFQLHNDTFEIPLGGTLLARGDKVKNQAFACRNTLGLQFHLELTAEIITDWAKSLRSHHQEKIARDTPRYIAESNRLCRQVTEDFIR